ncbi:MAG TPA: hypothetical protein VM074_03960 [Solimonas sp.]|nr:hypothetical protein [Solimonas sp.]
MDHNLQWDGISGSGTDPRPQNLAADDLRLLTGSPALDAGIAITGVTNHPDAQTVVGNPDQGAFEFGQLTWLPDASGDHVAPSVILTTPAEGEVYVVGEQVKASYHCVDDESGSGIARCTGSLQTGPCSILRRPGQKHSQ